MGKIQIFSCEKHFQEAIDAAVLRLKNGKPVALPTETVYGLAGSCENSNAIESIFFLKKRPLSDPLIVHVFDKSWACDFFDWNKDQKACFMSLAGTFWPGPLTFVMEARAGVSEVIRAGSPTVALRSPASAFFREVLQRFGRGLAAPSANMFGHISPTTARDVAEEFAGEDLAVFDGGACQVGIESTVLRIFRDGSLQVLRPGCITPAEIEECLERVGSKAVWRKKTSGSIVAAGASPGQELTHYAPRSPTFSLVEGTPRDEAEGRSLEKTVLIDFASRHQKLRTTLLGYIDPAPLGSLRCFTQELFGSLRKAEKTKGVQSILVYFPKDLKGQWSDALRDRIRRSSSGRQAQLAESEAFFIPVQV